MAEGDQHKQPLSKRAVESRSAQDAAFEDAAFAVFQALSPSKRLSREQIPFKRFKALVQEFVNKQKRGSLNFMTSKQLEPNGSSAHTFERKNGVHGGGNGMDISDDSMSRISFEENFSMRTRMIVRAAAEHASMKKNTQSPKIPKLVRKMAQTRARRRQETYTEDAYDFQCSKHGLPDQFADFYADLLGSRSNCVECFHVILNSLTKFFSHETWPTAVQSAVNEYLKEHVLMNCRTLAERYDLCTEDISAEIRLRDYEVMALLELHLLKDSDHSAVDVERTDVLNKLRFLYIAGGHERMRTFLDESISDTFAHIMPKVVVNIYEELCVTVPCDLEEYATPETSNADEIDVVPAAVRERKRKMQERLNRLINSEDSDEASPGTSTSGRTKRRRLSTRDGLSSRRRSKHRDLPRLSQGVTRRHPTTPTRTAEAPRQVRRSIFVPETPESKMNENHEKEKVDEDVATETVPQTPISKMNRLSSRRRSEKLEELLRKSAPRVSNVNGSSSSGCASRLVRPRCTAKLSPVRVRMSLSRAEFLPTPTSPSPPSPSQRSPVHSVKINLQQKLTRLSQPTTAENAIASTPPSPRSKPRGDFTLEKPVVEKYRKRLDGIRHSARRTDKNEVFYGRCTSRRNLFEEEEAGDMSAGGVATRSAACATLQKNRSGRSVHTSCVYMAHALLNVHNIEPLNPCKAPKQSPFKLHRLVRPATKSDRRRLSKLRIRIQRERVCLPPSLLSYSGADGSPLSPSVVCL